MSTEYTVDLGGILLEARGNLVTHRGHQVGCSVRLLYYCITVFVDQCITVYLSYCVTIFYLLC